MNRFSVSIPESVPSDLAQRVRDVLTDIEALTVENRVYALNESDLPDDADVQRDDKDLPYYVDGERDLFDEAAVGVDGNDVWIAVQSEIQKSHWTEIGHDYAGLAYDVMEEHGIERPGDDPNVGVQFGTKPVESFGDGPVGSPHSDVRATQDVMAVENVVRGAVSGGAE